MSKVRVHNFSISLDGYGAGPNQSREHPLGVGGPQLHQWAFQTRAFNEAHGESGGHDGVDDDFWRRGSEGIGAWIIGRNMFGPVRGPWGDSDWRGWWGEDPPYHAPVFVLTNHPRDPIPMQGGTTFYFVTDGIQSALELALAAADGHDVCIGGGVSTIQQYLSVGLVDEMHLAVVPVLLGAGERLFANIDGVEDRYECVEVVSSPSVVHVKLEPKQS